MSDHADLADVYWTVCLFVFDRKRQRGWRIEWNRTEFKLRWRPTDLVCDVRVCLFDELA